MTVTGFPTTYQPGQTYRIVVKHNAGSPIVNFNATTRIGSTSSIAGTFTPTTNCTLYAGTDGGIYANPHSIDSAVFQWTAPARGTGTISFYAAAFQGTTSSSSGQSGSIVVTSTEIVTVVQDQFSTPADFQLEQNFPNPFNPTTRIQFSLPKATIVKLVVFDVLGRAVTTLVQEYKQAGLYSVPFDGSRLASGVYLYRLTTPEQSVTRIMTLEK